MPYPPAPWPMHGQMWLSLFRVHAGDHPHRPPGVYGVALVDYEPPSPLTYGELLVARLADRRVPAPPPAHGRAPLARVEITDIWVDSPDSRDGGRALWAIPKGLCDLRRETTGGRLQRTAWTTSLAGVPVASARFSDISRLTLRTPFRAATLQTRAGGETVLAPFAGSARVLPCRGHWDLDAGGPLAWLAGKRPLASFRVADFAMSFG